MKKRRNGPCFTAGYRSPISGCDVFFQRPMLSGKRASLKVKALVERDRRTAERRAWLDIIAGKRVVERRVPATDGGKSFVTVGPIPLSATSVRTSVNYSPNVSGLDVRPVIIGPLRLRYRSPEPSTRT